MILRWRDFFNYLSELYCNLKCPPKREAEVEIIQTHTEKAQCEDGAKRDVKLLALKIGVKRPQPGNADSHQKLKGARNGFSLRKSP